MIASPPAGDRGGPSPVFFLTRNDPMIKSDETPEQRDRRLAQKRESYRRNREHHIATVRAYQAANPDKIKQYQTNARSNLDKAAELERTNRWRRENRDHVLTKRRARSKERYSTDETFRMTAVLRSGLIRALNGKGKGGSAIEALGCTIDELRAHLEARFTEGMTWDNWAMDGWHIDHIRPLSSFDLTDPKQVKQVCHYTNLAPLWAFDNMSKGSRVPAEN